MVRVNRTGQVILRAKALTKRSEKIQFKKRGMAWHGSVD